MEVRSSYSLWQYLDSAIVKTSMKYLLHPQRVYPSKLDTLSSPFPLFPLLFLATTMNSSLFSKDIATGILVPPIVNGTLKAISDEEEEIGSVISIYPLTHASNKTVIKPCMWDIGMLIKLWWCVFNFDLRMEQERANSLMSEQESEKVEIYFTLRMQHTDSVFLEVYLQETNQPKKKVLTTKMAAPNGALFDFPQSLLLDYFFQIRQKLIVEVWTAQRQMVGAASATVGEIYNGRSKGVQKGVEHGNNHRGSLTFKAEKVQRGSNKYVEFTLASRNVDVGSSFLCFGTGSAHWRLYKNKAGEDYLLYESEVKVGKDNRFNHLRINEKRLCNNNPEQPIIFRFYENTGHVIIGEARTNLASLSKGNHRLTLTKHNSEKGVILLQKFKQTVKYEFTDYLTNGLQMSMVVAIDFTASNGIQNQPSSLHYITPTKRSHYQEALHEVCSIVLDYDTDKLVPVFGFGAKVNMPTFNTAGKVHHCFPLNGTDTNPNLFQLDGILQGYRSALPCLSFGGPTFFAPLLREAMGVCQRMRDEVKDYMILLILTDGVIHDKEEVKDLLVQCGRLPLSVIIIGIGNGEDWSVMHQLDDDDCQMRDKQGNKTQRDLVQFVEFSKHNNNGVELAREVLEELPRQVEEYHNLVGLTPNDYRKNLNLDIMYQQQSIKL